MDPSGARDVPAPPADSAPGRPGWLIGALILGVALNLRAAVTSLSPFLDDVRHDLGIGGATAGLLTTLPVLCFAGIGALAPRLARAAGHRTVVGAAMAVLAGGLAVRAFAHGTVLFFVASAFALAGIALGNVLAPALVRLHFPHRVGPVMGLYSMCMSIGTAGAAAAAVPIARALGSGWRLGLGVWAIAAAAIAVPWLALWPSSRRPARAAAPGAPTGPTEPAGSAGHTARIALRHSGTAWALAIFFGAQALSAYVVMGWLPQIYRDAGLSAGYAGVMLAVVTGLSVPIALALPGLAARWPHQGPLAVFLTLLMGVSYLGLALAPATLPWLWAGVLGVGNGTFPLAIVMISLRSRHPSHTAALSGFVQGLGYLIAAAGPLTAGSLYQLTHGWGVPLAALGAVLVLQVVAGYLAGRPRHVEDDLQQAGPDRSDATATAQANAMPGGGNSSGASQGLAVSSPTR